MNNENIFDTLQNAQNEKFISEMGAFDKNIENAWGHGTVDPNSKEDKEAQKKREEKEKLKEKGFGKPEEDPKLIQASIDQLERFRKEYEKKRKFDYPTAIKLYDEVIDKLKDAKESLKTKQFSKAAEHCKNGTAAMSESKKLFNESEDQSQDIQD